MKRFLALVALIAIALHADAARRGVKAIMASAQAVAQRHLGGMVPAARFNIVWQEGQIAIVSAEGVGTVFVCCDDTRPAVMGWCQTPFEAGTLPDGLLYWLEQANSQMVVPALFATSTVSDVPNFLTAQWGQDAPYNMSCPVTGRGDCPAGCVATAMAQIFYYYQYPVRLNTFGGCSYTIQEGRDRQEVTLSSLRWFSTPYDWTNMRDVYGGRDTDAGAKAVASLMRDCGYAVHMNYSAEGSGASVMDVPYAAAYHFGYDSLSVATLMREYYTDEEWYAMMYGELSSGHPVLYGATDRQEGGHAFVLSGLQENGMVYVNWGWNGAYNGWFDISLLRPEPSGANGTFNGDQHMVLGFRPERAHPSGKRQPNAESLLVLERPDLTTVAGALMVSAQGLYNMMWRTLNGYVAMWLENAEDEECVYNVLLLSPEEGDNLPFGYGWDLRQGWDYLGFFEEEDLADMPAGKYYFCILSQALDEDRAQLARTEGVGRALWSMDIDSNHKVSNLQQVTDSEEVDTFTSVSAPAAAPAHHAMDGNTYNLAGQRVGPAARGIVVRGGRKMLVR